MENKLIDDYEKEQISNFIAKHTKDGVQPTCFLIEVVPRSVSTDVKISVIENREYNLETSNSTSLIDWKNYDF